MCASNRFILPEEGDAGFNRATGAVALAGATAPPYIQAARPRGYTWIMCRWVNARPIRLLLQPVLQGRDQPVGIERFLEDAGQAEFAVIHNHV